MNETPATIPESIVFRPEIGIVPSIDLKFVLSTRPPNGSIKELTVDHVR
jgi:hypothetical protein